MAQRRNNDPQFPERGGGSLLRTAIASTPLTIGVTSALRGIAVDGSLKQPREAGLDQAMRTLGDIARNRNGPPIPSIENMNRFMNVTRSKGMNQTAWAWSTQSVDPFTRRKMLNMTKEISTMSDVEARSAISATVTGNDSVAMGRIWQRFQKNINLLETQAGQFGLPTFVGAGQLPGFQQAQTIGIATPIPSSIQAGIERVRAAMGTGVTQNLYGITRPEIASEGLGAWNVTFQGTGVGDIRVQLPQISGGVLAEGAELQTRRIAPDFVVTGPGGQLTRMNRTEMFLSELEKGIAPEIGGRLKTQRDVERAIKQLKGEVFGKLESSPSITMEGRTAAQAQREAQRGMAVKMVAPVDYRTGGGEYRSGFRAVTEEERVAAAMSQQGRAIGLTGGVGPKGLSQGMMSTVDFDRFSIGPVEHSRRPEQSFRQFQISEESMKNLGQFDPKQKYRALQMEGDRLAYENVARPHLKAVYVDPVINQGFMEKFAMGEGEAIIRAQTGDKMIFEESVTKKLIEAREDIDSAKIQGGELLGLTPEGKPFNLPRNATITSVKRATSGEATVEMMQRHQFAHGGKLFGGAKALALFREDEEFLRAKTALKVGSSDAQIIVSMDELRKNRALHRRQMVDSLQDILGRREGAPSTRAQARFMSNPVRMGQEWASQSYTKAGVFSEQQFTERAMRFAVRGMDVNPAEFGEAFGAVPYVFGDNAPGGVVSSMIQQALPSGVSRTAYETVLGKGISMGSPSFAYGGPMLDVGGMGSVEPRIFDILKGGSMGKVGEDIGEELAQRLAMTSPETLIAHEELAKTLSSMTGAGGTATDATVYRQGQSFQKFLERGGGVIRGAGIDDIHVPGMDVMQQLLPYETHTGVTTRGKVSDIYSDIASKVGQAEEGLISPEVLKKDLSFQADVLRREFAPGGKGIGAIGRGKVLGSRFLRGVSSQRVGGAASAITQANVVGITESNFQGMWNEMAESGLYKNDMAGLEKMKTTFQEGGEVAGMLSRHPLIGEFSTQPVRMKMISGRDDLIVLPEINRNVRIATEAGGEFTEKTLSFGPMVGLAGDKDADAYSAMLLSPRNEKAVRKSGMLADSEYTQRYAQHQVRMGLFKPGKAVSGGDSVPLKQMLSEVEKLSVGQKWIAPLSLEMTSAKRALTKFGKGAAAADARFLLEWLEQTPISAKHMSAQQASGGGLQSLMASITESMEARDDKLLRGNIASIVKDDTVSKAMLHGNVFTDSEGARAISEVTGTKMSKQIRGVDLHNATRELMRTLNESDRTGFTRTSELMSGRGSRAKMMEIAEMSAKGAFAGMREAPGMMKQVSSAYSSATNKLGALGAGLIRHHKAIGLGFAGTIALGAILSDPPKTVGPGRGKIPDARLNMNRRKAANRMKPENVHPQGKDVGAPSIPQVMRNQTVRLSMSPPSGGARINVRAPAGANSTAIAAGFSGMGRNSSVNFRDNRSSLSPHEIASKLM